jgi:hypothetical protein
VIANGTMNVDVMCYSCTLRSCFHFVSKTSLYQKACVYISMYILILYCNVEGRGDSFLSDLKAETFELEFKGLF